MSANQSESINQLKGRVFEAMLSGSLLFENKNELTSSLFVPNAHYIEYENFQDLIKLLDFVEIWLYIYARESYDEIKPNIQHLRTAIANDKKKNAKNKGKKRRKKTL